MESKVSYELNTDELKPVIEMVQQALLMRPNPTGVAYEHLQAGLNEGGVYFDGLLALTQVLGRGSTQDLQRSVEKMAEDYHRFWARPFAPGLAVAQPLFSAVLERPMRDLLHALVPMMAYENTDHLPDGCIVLDAQDELGCFTGWLDTIPAYQRAGIPSVRPYNLGRYMVASFLLGWWFGA